MRSLKTLLLGSLFLACGTGHPPEPSGPAPEAREPETTGVVADWPGYYDGTLPCADCAGIETQLWVRSDSTFILRQRYLGKDSLAIGTMGQWHLVNGLMTIGYTGDKPEFYRYTEKGIRMVDEMGQPFLSDHPHLLEKLAGELQEEVPRMRVQGEFTYQADAKSFRPCGSRFTWPCAGGLDQEPEEGELLHSMTGAELERTYLKAVGEGGRPWTIEVECSLGMGPAMEGDGADEYLFIHRVIRDGFTCP